MAIEGYGGGGFRIAGKRLTGSLVLLPDRILAWPVTSLAELTPASLDCVAAVADDVEFLLLGCGTEEPWVPNAVRDAMRAHRVAIDAMATGAACRTFNILTAEARPVAAALIAVD